jgi:hypothetical protein
LKASEDKGAYHGVFIGQRSHVLIEAIQVEEKIFSFPPKVKTPRGKLKLHYRAHVDADLMQGKLKTPCGAIPFMGKRKK